MVEVPVRGLADLGLPLVVGHQLVLVWYNVLAEVYEVDARLAAVILEKVLAYHNLTDVYTPKQVG